MSLLVLTAVFFTLLVGCGGSGNKSSSSSDTSSSSNNASSSGDTSKKAEDSQKPVTIVHTSFRYEDEAIIQELADKFHNENPNITVKLDFNQDTAAYYQTLKANLSSGGNIDTFDIHPNFDFVTYAREGVIVDLTNEPFAANLTDGAKSIATVDGKVYGLIRV